ncbi:MAG: hypothetical protein CMD14_03545 [Flavobacteriales bacterium]|nr:hypothetical protein [Flavobacteriales bacterium]
MKNKQAILLLFLANIVSGIAQGISMIAIPWYFVKIVSRPDMFANSYLLITFLTLFWGLYAGTLVDRYSRKRLFIIINIVCGILIGTVAFYGSYHSFLPDFLVVFVFGITIFNYNVHYPNLYAFGQEITEPRNYGKLNSYIEVQGQVTSVLAGALAAILLTGTNNNMLEIGGVSFVLPFNIEPWNIYEIFMLDAATYVAVIFLFVFIKYKRIVKEKIHTDSLLERLKGGFKYLRDHPIVFVFGLASYMLFAFTLVEIHVVLPLYVKNFLGMGGNVFASAEIYYSFGAIFSGLLILRLFKKFNTAFSVITLMLVVACAFFLMFRYNFLWIFFLGNFLLGITNAGVRILRTTYIFNNVPNNLIGRAGSVFNTLNIVVRMLLIGIFTISFFHIEDNIRFGYLLGTIMMVLSIIPLLIWYDRIISREN